MDANQLVERVARAIREAPMRVTMARPDRVIDPNIPVTDGDMLRARAALREIVAAAGIKPDPDSGRLVAVDALDKNGMHLRALGAEEMAVACESGAALLRALAEGGE